MWEPWIDGFERAMRLRPDAWEEIALSDDEEAQPVHAIRNAGLLCRHDAARRRLATAGRWKPIPVSTSTRANQGGTHAHLQLQEEDGATGRGRGWQGAGRPDRCAERSAQARCAGPRRARRYDLFHRIRGSGLAPRPQARRPAKAAAAARAGRSLARAMLFAPLEPAVILCSGENYWDHRAEKPVVEGKEPEFFIKLQQCANGPYDDIVYEPKITGKLDYETELAIVIGKGGRHIAKRDAMKHIFGFTVMNDVTARDRQVKMRPDGTSRYALGPGKNFDTSAPLGPLHRHGRRGLATHKSWRSAPGSTTSCARIIKLR